MKILRGRYAGQTAKLHQFANDWMSVDLHEGRQGVIVRPDQVQLDPDERASVVDSPHVGSFWREWKLNDDGTFTALRERQPRRSRRHLSFQDKIDRDHAALGGHDGDSAPKPSDARVEVGGWVEAACGCVWRESRPAGFKIDPSEPRACGKHSASHPASVRPSPQGMAMVPVTYHDERPPTAGSRPSAEVDRG